MQAVARAGARLVAVGARGMIAVSADQGRTWTQVVSPVQSDLVALHFPSATQGWAVGHDGVVLHSADGGTTWTRQLDGRMAREQFTRHYANAAAPAEVAAARAVAENYKAGASLPFLDVWFDDEQHGFVVGAFGLLAATADGGKSWTPWMDRIDNQDLLSLNAVRGGDGGVYIVGERGTTFRLDRGAGRFVRSDTGYEGSFFGVAVSPGVVLAYGLRGALYRSADKGASWTRVATPSGATISAGTALAESAGFVLANQAGELMLLDATGTRFGPSRATRAWRYTGATVAFNGQLLLSAMEGIALYPVR
jgi:photosystem II stability/assembly factor-like uncharacterized protein